MQMRTGRLDVTVGAHGRELILEGQIDERAQLSPLVDRLAERVVVDLEKVSFINSIGVREWIRLLRALADRKIHVTLRRCSEAMVYQLNMIVDTSAGADIESFFAPYSCATCGYEGSLCVELAPHLELLGRMQAPELPCPECQQPMQLAELPQRYLLFIERVAPKSPG